MTGKESNKCLVCVNYYLLVEGKENLEKEDFKFLAWFMPSWVHGYRNFSGMEERISELTSHPVS